jgi:gluconolactonase
MYAWDEVNGLRPWRFPSGVQTYAGGPLLEPGTNGLLFHGKSGKLLSCDHGRRQISVFSSGGTSAAPFGGNNAVVSTLVNTTERGLRFNSPNDLAFDPKGTLYFTDPSYGLKRTWGPAVPEDSPGRDLSSNCVYAVVGAEAALLSPHSRPVTALHADVITCSINRPNGIGVSPDGSTLYVGDSSRLQSYWRVCVCARIPVVLNSCLVRNGFGCVGCAVAVQHRGGRQSHTKGFLAFLDSCAANRKVESGKS